MAISTQYLDWKDSILKVKDIINSDKTLIDKLNLEEKLGNQIRNIPQTSLVDNSIPNLCPTNFCKVNNQQVYMHCAKALYSTPTSQHKWIEYYPFLEMNDWKQIYLLPFKLVSNSSLINFQFKIIYRVFNCNYKLYTWKIKDSPDCIQCSHTHNLEQYFFYCHFVKHFWDQVEKWLFSKFQIQLMLLF